jgi:hypothetical protein
MVSKIIIAHTNQRGAVMFKAIMGSAGEIPAASAKKV